MNRLNWVSDFCILFAAVGVALLAGILCTYVPTTTVTLLYSDSVFSRTEMWILPTIIVTFPFFWLRRKERYALLLGVCILCRVLLTVPVALLCCQFIPSADNTLNVESYGYHTAISLYWWMKVLVFFVNALWYYVVFRLLKRITTAPSKIVIGIVLFGLLAIELLFLFWNSPFMVPITMLTMFSGMLLGDIIIRKAEKTNDPEGNMGTGNRE